MVRTPQHAGLWLLVAIIIATIACLFCSFSCNCGFFNFTQLTFVIGALLLEAVKIYNIFAIFSFRQIYCGDCWINRFLYLYKTEIALCHLYFFKKVFYICVFVKFLYFCTLHSSVFVCVFCHQRCYQTQIAVCRIQTVFRLSTYLDQHITAVA